MSMTDLSSKGWIQFGPEQRRYVDRLETELASLKRQVAEAVALLKRVNKEFGKLVELDSPEYVCPDDDLWIDIVNLIRDSGTENESPLDRLAKQVSEAGLYDCDYQGENGGEG